MAGWVGGVEGVRELVMAGLATSRGQIFMTPTIHMMEGECRQPGGGAGWGGCMGVGAMVYTLSLITQYLNA